MKIIILCYIVFQCNDIIETTAAHFLKKNQVVKLHRHEFKSESNLNKLACNTLLHKKNFKTKSIHFFPSPLDEPWHFCVKKIFLILNTYL